MEGVRATMTTSEQAFISIPSNRYEDEHFCARVFLSLILIAVRGSEYHHNTHFSGIRGGQPSIWDKLLLLGSQQTLGHSESTILYSYPSLFFHEHLPFQVHYPSFSRNSITETSGNRVCWLFNFFGNYIHTQFQILIWKKKSKMFMSPFLYLNIGA